MGDEKDDGPDNVIAFPSIKEMRESGGPVSRGPFKLNECFHYQHGFLVDDRAREVTCKRCKKVVDAFDALSGLAHHWDWAHSRHAKKQAEEEAARVTEDLHRLRAVRSKVKNTGYMSVASIKKAFDRLAEEVRRWGAVQRASGDKKALEYAESVAHSIRTAKERLLDGENS